MVDWRIIGRRRVPALFSHGNVCRSILVGRLVNKVTLSLFEGFASKARCAANGRVLCKHRNAAGEALKQTRGAGRTGGMPALNRHSHSGAMLAKDPAIRGAPRLACEALEQTECHLIYQTAH